MEVAMPNLVRIEGLVDAVHDGSVGGVASGKGCADLRCDGLHRVLSTPESELAAENTLNSIK